MTTNEFIIEFQDIIQTENEITTDTVLSELEEWDSMSIMASMTWFDVKLKVKLTFNDFLSLKTVQDIIDLSQGKIAG